MRCASMMKMRRGQRSSHVELGPCVRLLTIVGILLTAMSGTTGSSVVPGQEDSADPFASPSTSGDEGMEPADIIAIVLGILLLVFIICVIVVLCLIKKGKICVSDDNKKVAPVGFLSGYSTTPERVKDCSFVAMTREQSLRRATPRDNKSAHFTDTDSIIYMYDDIYRPPHSRQIPTQKATVDAFTAVERRPTGHMYDVPRKHKQSRRERRPNHIQRQHSRSTHNSAPTPPPTPEPETDLGTIPNSGRFSITTHGRSPYDDRHSYRY